jgi:hypothetical protein
MSKNTLINSGIYIGSAFSTIHAKSQLEVASRHRVTTCVYNSRDMPRSGQFDASCIRCCREDSNLYLLISRPLTVYDCQAAWHRSDRPL